MGVSNESDRILTFQHLRLLHLFLQVLELWGLFHVDGSLNPLQVLHVDLVFILLPLVRKDLVGGWYSSVHFYCFKKRVGKLSIVG